jgi:apolipoprotein D and lipocalin family protein
MTLKNIYFLFFICLFSCQDDNENMNEIKTVPYVDLNKFMGDWYVIANIPTFLEKNATNAVESYKLNSKGEVETTFSFYKNSPEGEKKTYYPKGFIVDKKSNAVWKMQFLWPFKLTSLIIDLAVDYSYTVIGVPNRKYVWIMSRKPELSEKTYKSILEKLESIGYDLSKIKKLPQFWNDLK